jgi:hypothetical protein
MHLVRHHRFAVPRAAENDSTVALASRNRFCCWPDKKRVIDRRLSGKRPDIFHLMSQFAEQGFHLLLQFEAGVIGSERNFHYPV